MRTKTISLTIVFTMAILLALTNFNANAQKPPPQNLSVVPISSVASWEAPAGANPIGYKLFLADSLVAELAYTTFNYTFECLQYSTDYTANLIAVYDSGESEAVSFYWISTYLKPVQQPFTEFVSGSNEVTFHLSNIQGCDDGGQPDRLISFNIYLYGELISNVHIAHGEESVTFSVNNLSPGQTTFCATAVYDLGIYGLSGETGESDWVCEDVNISLECESPDDLTGEVYDWHPYPLDIDGTQLKWYAPERTQIEERWQHYDSGENHGAVGAGPEALFGAIRWDEGTLQAFDGDTIEAVKFYAKHGDLNYFIIKIWTGNNANTLIYSDTAQDIILESWNIHNLTETIIIDGEIEYWVGYEVYYFGTGYNYPMAHDLGPATKGYGDKVSLDGGKSWDNLSDLGPDFNVNWNLQMLIDTNELSYPNGLEGFNILKKEPDGDEYTQIDFVEFYDWKSRYCIIDTCFDAPYTCDAFYKVNTLWVSDGDTCISEFAPSLNNPDEDFVYVMFVDIEENEMEESNLLISPNPTSTTLTIKSEEKLQSVSITNLLGQKVYEYAGMEQDELQIDVSSFPNGVYLVKAKNEKGLEVKKFIKN